MTGFQEFVDIELTRARRKNEPFHSLHEGFAVILEEVDELWDEVRKKPKNRLVSEVLGELIQVAAMCQRLAEDMGYV